MHTTPFLIDVRRGTFEEYLASLAKTGRKNYRYVEKNNADLVYERIPFDRALIEQFMKLWEQQTIDGRKRQWNISIGFLEYLDRHGKLICLTGKLASPPDEVLAVQFVEQHGGYVFCHPPMYSKDAHNDRYIAKFMWFQLVKFALGNPEIQWLDMGGGNRGSWRSLLEQRADDTSYKWLYVPEATKSNPTDQPLYTVRRRLLRYEIYLTEISNQPGGHLTRIKDHLITLVWFNRGRRLEKLGSAILRRLHLR